ncbi:NAD(P)-dependent oxidoreductase [Actinopolymorpha alba]|uniref:NAD(P)-dependent oxidoreductase n=1 Tax=Actinopolymorpha alba TaxID=533267 RepID=UPI000375BC02|nr:NAD(P)-dependent oxidoreductase [Actinopolymorpha alba]
MSLHRPAVGIACDPRIRDSYLAPADLARLESFARVSTADFAGQWSTTAPRLLMVGDLEGDRFGGRVDVAAASARGVRVVDTTHGSSYPVAEWALALSIMGLRDAGRRFRALVAGVPHPDEAGWPPRELTGRTVGLIGFGHIAWRLVELLAPFHVELLVHDPYAPRELADALGVTFAPLDHVLAHSDVVICLAPLTSQTRGMLGARELDLLRPGSVFVNVSRGAVVDTAGLVARLRRDDIIACLDVHDPEPIPVDADVRNLPNVFLSPHIAGTTPESRSRFFRLMVDDLERTFTGAEPRAMLTARIVSVRNAAVDPEGVDPPGAGDEPGGGS